MDSNLRRIHFALIAILTFVLSACGGGGGGGGGNESPPANTSVSGSAVKGIIKHGLVEIFAIESGVVATTPIFSTTTDEQGDYTFTLDPSFNGSVLVVISDANDTGNPTTTTCDYSSGCGAIDGTTMMREYAFGDDMPMGGLELRAFVTNVVGGTPNTAALTMLTTMAAAYAETLSGGLTSENINIANSKVANLFGVNNIITTVPPDITTEDASDLDSNASKYAYLSSAIADIASQDFGGNISDAINALAASYVSHDGELVVSESTDSPGEVSLLEILGPAYMEASADSNSGQIANDLESLAMLYDGMVDTTTTSEPSPNTGLGELEMVKAFVSDVRTWGTVIKDEVNQSNNTFDQQVDLASTMLDTAGPLLEDAVKQLGTVIGDIYIDGVNSNPDLSTYFSPTDPVNPVYAEGTVSVIDSASMRTISIDGIVNDVTIVLTLEAPQFDANGNAVGTEFNFAVTQFSAHNVDAIAGLESGSLQLAYGESIDLTTWLNGTAVDPLPDPDRVSIEMTNASIAEYMVVDPVSFSGTASFSVVGSMGEGTTVQRDLIGNVIQYNPEHVTLSGTISNSANVVSMSLSATMANADTFMPVVNPLQIGDVHPGLASYAFSNGNNTLTVTMPSMTISFTYDADSQSPTYQQVIYSYTTAYYSGEYSLGIGPYSSLQNFIDTSNSYALTQTFYEWVDGEGEYAVTLPGTFNLAGGTIDGVMTYPADITDENDTMFRELTDVSLSFSAQLEGLPLAQFTVTADRTGFDDGTFGVNVSYGGRRVELSASAVNSEIIGQVDITNQDGVVLNITRDNLTNNGVIMYDNMQYATIETVNGVTVIRYIDGFFETL